MGYCPAFAAGKLVNNEMGKAPDTPCYILIGPEDKQHLEEARQGLAPRLDYRLLAAHLGGTFIEGAPSPAQIPLWRPLAILRSLWGNIRLSIRLLRRLPENSLVYSTGETWGIPCALVAKLLVRRRLKHYIFVHRVYSRQWRLLLPWLRHFMNVDGWICVTKKQKQALQKMLGAQARITVISQGIDTRFFDPQLAQQSHQPPYILSIGAEMRDYPLLFDAVRNLELEVVVKASSRWMNTGRGQIKDIPDNVTIIARRLTYVEMRNLYSGAALVVVPLRDTLQAAGITTILEAMAMKKYVVATMSAGLPDILVNHRTGSIVKPDPSELAAEILRVIECSQQHIVNAAFEIVQEQNSQERYISRIVTVFA